MQMKRYRTLRKPKDWRLTVRWMDERTKKLITLYKALHPIDDIDRIYVLTKENVRKFSSIEDFEDASIQGPEKCIRENKEEHLPITAMAGRETTNTRKEKEDGLVWFGFWVLWHINLCRSFYVKSIFI